MRLIKDKTFLTALAILLMTIFISVLVFLDFIETGSIFGPFRVGHWMAWIGTFFIAIYTPLFYFLKRRYPTKLKLFLNIHIFGFLISFMFISIHFAGQLSRPPQFFPELREGLALYITMIILVATGFLHRFQLIPKKGNSYYPSHFNKFLHAGVTTTFYIVILVHIIHNLGFI